MTEQSGNPPSPVREAKPRFVILTGLSGAGKTEAVRCLEDLGFFCVDNLPPALIPKFAELCAHSNGRVAQAALVMDVRGGAFFNDLQASLDELQRMGFDYRILFLEASEDALVGRFKESRRRHPLAEETGSLHESIEEERLRLGDVRARADKVIDTSRLPVQELKQEVASLFGSESQDLLISMVSFGFKYGIPTDADFVFDVRFLRNPHYVEALRPLTGADPAAAEYVLADGRTRQLLAHIEGLLAFCLPQQREEGKAYVTLGIGCTGGRHRAVTIAEELRKSLRAQGYRVVLEHRDIPKVSAVC